MTALSVVNRAKEAAPEEEQAPAQDQADTKGVSQTDEEAFHAVRLAITRSSGS